MSKHILVIEPSHIIRKILEVHFQLVGHRVRTFATYGLAGRALPLFQYEPPHLAFVALHSSQPDSYSLLKQVRIHYPDVALVALVMPEESAHRNIQMAQQEARAVALIKPFKIEDALALCGPAPTAARSPYAMSSEEQKHGREYRGRT